MGAKKLSIEVPESTSDRIVKQILVLSPRVVAQLSAPIQHVFKLNTPTKSACSTPYRKFNFEATTPKQRLAQHHEMMKNTHEHLFNHIQYFENHEEDNAECFSARFKIHMHDDDGVTGCGDDMNIMDFCANSDSFTNDVTCMANLSPRVAVHPHKRSSNTASKIKRALNFIAVSTLSGKKNMSSHMRNLQVLSPRSPRTCS